MQIKLQIYILGTLIGDKARSIVVKEYTFPEFDFPPKIADVFLNYIFVKFPKRERQLSISSSSSLHFFKNRIIFSAVTEEKSTSNKNTQLPKL